MTASASQYLERIQGCDHTFDDRIRAELPLRYSKDGRAVESLGSGEGVEVDRQRKLVGVVLHTVD
jgi:hypothetical protein